MTSRCVEIDLATGFNPDVDTVTDKLKSLGKS